MAETIHEVFKCKLHIDVKILRRSCRYVNGIE